MKFIALAVLVGTAHADITNLGKACTKADDDCGTGYCCGVAAGGAACKSEACTDTTGGSTPYPNLLICNNSTDPLDYIAK